MNYETFSFFKQSFRYFLTNFWSFLHPNEKYLLIKKWSFAKTQGRFFWANSIWKIYQLDFEFRHIGLFFGANSIWKLISWSLNSVTLNYFCGANSIWKTYQLGFEFRRHRLDFANASREWKLLRVMVFWDYYKCRRAFETSCDSTYLVCSQCPPQVAASTNFVAFGSWPLADWFGVDPSGPPSRGPNFDRRAREFHLYWCPGCSSNEDCQQKAMMCPAIWNSRMKQEFVATVVLESSSEILLLLLSCSMWTFLCQYLEWKSYFAAWRNSKFNFNRIMSAQICL